MSIIEGLRRFRRRHLGLIEAPLIAAIAATSFIYPSVENVKAQGTIPPPPGPVEPPPQDGDVFHLPLVMNGGEHGPQQPFIPHTVVRLPIIYRPVVTEPVTFGAATLNADDSNGASAAPIIAGLIGDGANVIGFQEVKPSETAGYAEQFDLTCVNSRKTAICVRSGENAEISLTGSVYRRDIPNAFEERDLLCVAAQVEKLPDGPVKDVGLCVGHPHYRDPIPQLQETRSVIEGELQHQDGFEDITAVVYMADTNAESSQATAALNLSPHRVACNEEGGVVCPGEVPDRGLHPGDVDNIGLLIPEARLTSAGASNADSFGGITGGKRGENNDVSDHNSVSGTIVIN